MGVLSLTLSTLLASSLSFSGVSAAPTISSLQACIALTGVNASLPANSTWEEDSAAWQLRIQPEPVIVTYPTTRAQIAATLSCAQTGGVKVAARNGGHSYGSYGVGGNSGALVIDMHAFQSTSYDAATGYLTYGGGGIVGTVATWLWKNHGAHFPHVRANRVGLAGSSIGGGFGSTSRFLGTPMDFLTSVEYMLYNGTIVTCSREKNADLFWVAQGAGSSYGILLSLTTKTWKPVEQIVTNFTITLNETDIHTGVEALLAIQDYMHSGSCPDELSLRWSLTAPPFTGSGFYYGPPDNFDSAISPLLSSLPAKTNVISSRADFWTMENIATPLLDQEVEVYPARSFYLQSLVLRTDEPFTYASAYALYNHTTFSFSRKDMTKFGFIDMWGGVSRNVRDTDTSFEHANSQFLIRWEGRLVSGLTQFPADGIAYMKAGLQPFRDQLADEGIKLRGFVNYRDTELTLDEWSARLYGANWQRMLSIKRANDPLAIFTTNPQSIPLN